MSSLPVEYILKAPLSRFEAALQSFLGHSCSRGKLTWIVCHHCGYEHAVNTGNDKRMTYVCHDITYVVVEGDEVFNARRLEARQRAASSS